MNARNIDTGTMDTRTSNPGPGDPIVKELVVEPADGRAFRGRLRAPGDKSISHRALLIAARAEGRSRVRGLSNGDDVRHTLEAIIALGPGRAGPGRAASSSRPARNCTSTVASGACTSPAISWTSAIRAPGSAS